VPQSCDTKAVAANVTIAPPDGERLARRAVLTKLKHALGWPRQLLMEASHVGFANPQAPPAGRGGLRATSSKNATETRPLISTRLADARSRGPMPHGVGRAEIAREALRFGALVQRVKGRASGGWSTNTCANARFYTKVSERLPLCPQNSICARDSLS
jgi:hypothetical protein